MLSYDSYPETFIALDLETTGLDPQKDEIFEIGAVKIIVGKTSEVFSELVLIHNPLPFGIRKLTGIQESDLKDKPSIQEILPKLERFLEKDPLVLHNPSFDLSFLDKNGLKIVNTVYDTLELSRILLPTLKNHKLKTLLEVFHIQEEQSHRAVDDAEGVAKLFLSLLKLLDELEPETLDRILRLVRPVRFSEKELFEIAVKRSFEKALIRKKKIVGDPEIVSGHELPLQPTNTIGSGKLKEKKEIIPLDPKEAEGFFQQGGLLSKSLSGYESRREQAEMATSVTEAFNQKQYLIAEAGTGTGKSLAYLIPSILWACRNGERVILSTNTKNLQDQLFYKDLPLLKKIMEEEFRVTLLKGRSNYLCPKRWKEILRNPDLYLSSEERIAILPLILLAEKTQTGDISENHGFHLEMNSGLWAKLTCPERNEKDSHQRCFLTIAREAAQKSHLVIVNHPLLLSDLATENRILTPFTRLVLDEAHNLEKVATEHLGIEVSFYRLKRIIVRLQEGQRRGLLPLLQNRVERGRISGKIKESLLRCLENLLQKIPETQEKGIAFFQIVSSSLPSRKMRYKPSDLFLEKIGEEGDELYHVLNKLESELETLRKDLQDLKPFQENLQDLEDVSYELHQYSKSLGLLLFDLREDWCYWAESREDPLRSELHAVPVDVGPLLAEELYKKMDSILFTSATLTVASSFEFFMNRTGFSRLDPDRVDKISVGSSFSFPEQTQLLIPNYLPSPKSSNFSQRVGEIIRNAILSTKRGTMILTTSYDLINFLDQQLRRRLEENGIELLVQGKSGSRRGILEIFKEEKNSCLLGTDSFWEGVDVPGESLELLILTKLPFPVPDDPIVEARCETLEKKGLDPFASFMIPTAAIRLRQGFGRLIRTRNDRGVVLLLDNRVIRNSYGEFFLNSLPVEPVICSSEEEVLKALSDFWR